jgi:hypothetical protein
MAIKIFYTTLLLIFMSVITGMELEEKNQLRLQVIEMFKHAFNSYMVLNYSFLNIIFIDFYL